ncbi:MAG: hypothetical protein KKF44_06295 [Nanoarchaeota archaeon]|nr:hypothetical protein [Nanoarchaeota archaeon]
MSKKRCQVSMEFLMIFGFAFTMLVPLIIVFQIQSGQTRDNLNVNQILNIGTRIIDKVESIYYLGEPSKTTLKVMFPDHIEDITIDNREFVFYYRNNDNLLQEIPFTSLVNITGTVATYSGIHYITIQAAGDYVSIGG